MMLLARFQSPDSPDSETVYNLRVTVYNKFVNREVAVAQLSIVDGAWQESPDNVAIVEEVGRGTLYIVAEVAGDAEGRDQLARELVETARRAYAASRGSFTAALTQAIREANNLFYTYNLNTPPEARRIAGISAVVLREEELFIAQGGPGLTCVVRGNTLHLYPDESPWFDPSDEIGEFITPGTVPLGLRREYTPDLFHVALHPGDTIVLSTRALIHLLTNDELLDTLLNRHPDEIVENLEDIAGAADLSAIAIRFAIDLAPVPLPSRPAAVLDNRTMESGAVQDLSPVTNNHAEPPVISPDVPIGEEDVGAGYVVEGPTEEELAFASARAEEERERRRLQIEKARAGWAQIVSGILGAIAGALAAVAGVFTRIDWTRIGAAADRAISALLRGFVHLVIFAIRAFLPGAPDEGRTITAAPTASKVQQTAWRLAALIFPLLLLIAGGTAWIGYRQDVKATQDRQLAELLNQANTAIDAGKKVSGTNKIAAREFFQKAMTLAQQARTLSPTNPAPRTLYNSAEDLYNGANGVSVLFLFNFATFDTKANPTRIVTRIPDIFIFDRGLQRILRYATNDAGTPVPSVAGDGVILKSGDKIGEKTVGELIDMTWIDAGRLVALDRSGLFLLYDPVKSSWTARAATDGSQWARVTMASSYVGNLYLLDPSKNQILRYIASAEGVWSSSNTYFLPNVNVDLSSAVDIAVDGDVWVLRADGSIWRFTGGKLNDFTPRDLETPLSKSTSLFTSKETAWLYVADAGNQRIVQFDKVTGKFVRQFKPRSDTRDAFNALKVIAADETSKKFFMINGNQAYLANIPQ